MSMLLPTTGIKLPPQGRRSIYKWDLTNAGKKRVDNDEFYLKESHPKRRDKPIIELSDTEKIFRALYNHGPLITAEISYYSGVKKRSVNAILSFNYPAGFVYRIDRRLL